MTNIDNIITESINKVLSEALCGEASLPANAMKGQNIIAKIQNLIDQANNAYQEVYTEYGDNMCLMDKNAEIYGLSGKIVLSKNGLIKIPMVDNYNFYTDHKLQAIKVFTKIGGKYTFYKDELGGEDWRYAKKILANIIADAKRFKEDMAGYDPNWEDPNEGNPQAIRDFNKKSRVKADARKVF
jgi:hypothetical protein